MSINVKICGLRDDANVKAAVEFGAKYVGFVFYKPSKRFISPDDADALTAQVPPNVKRVGLVVDATDEELRVMLSAVHLDILQLHGNEAPIRVKAIRGLTGLQVMKAIRVGAAEDLQNVTAYEAVADYLMFDAKIGEEPGGTGKSFDWTLLRGLNLTKPWMLAGGLNITNLAEAVRVTGTKAVDISSGVEDAPGQKNPDKIREFIRLAKTLG